MSEETQAAPAPAEVEDVFQGQQVSLSEFSKYRQDGELPERFKPADKADSTPAATLEETEKTEGEDPKPAPDSDPEEKQEPPPKATPAEKRIKQLLAEKKELELKLAEKQGVQTDSSPAPAPPTRPKPTPEDKNPDGTPKYSTYEDVVEAIGRWAAQEERATWQSEQAQLEAQKALKSKLDEARARYDDADTVIFPAAKSIADAQIPQVVKEVFVQSDAYIDLCYVVGSDPKELAKFIELAQSNPRAAIGKVFEYERGIREELSPKNDTPRDDKGKFTAPEAKKTSAPKPPSPVGGASSRAFDVSDESLSTEQWALKRNQDLQKRKG